MLSLNETVIDLLHTRIQHHCEFIVRQLQQAKSLPQLSHIFNQAIEDLCAKQLHLQNLSQFSGAFTHMVNISLMEKQKQNLQAHYTTQSIKIREMSNSKICKSS